MNNQIIYAVIGYTILSIPFIALAVFIIKDSGWKAFFFVFGITLILFGIGLFGIYFLQLAGVVK